MKRSQAVVAATALLPLLLGLVACGQDDDAPTATDPAPSSAAPDPLPSEVPSEVPAAAGPVRTRDIALVMDTGEGPELCLGPIAESDPPQCSGPAVLGWDWAERRGTFERRGDVRWGSYAVTGTWDGTAFTVADAISGALYDPAAPAPVVLPEPSRSLSEDELQEVAADLVDTVPGLQGTEVDQAGHVLVDVTYDDGTLQDHLDDTYGDGVVVVRSALVDA